MVRGTSSKTALRLPLCDAGRGAGGHVPSNDAAGHHVLVTVAGRPRYRLLTVSVLGSTIGSIPYSNERFFSSSGFPALPRMMFRLSSFLMARTAFFQDGCLIQSPVLR